MRTLNVLLIVTTSALYGVGIALAAAPTKTELATSRPEIVLLLSILYSVYAVALVLINLLLLASEATLTSTWGPRVALWFNILTLSGVNIYLGSSLLLILLPFAMSLGIEGIASMQRDIARDGLRIRPKGGDPL